MMMRTYFSRHTETLDVDEATREMLWSERRIAIHFPDAIVGGESPTTDSTSLDPDDYPSNGKKALRALRALAEEGGYVYSEHSPRQTPLVGYVEPNTKIELLRGVWGTRNGRNGQTAILKSLRLTRCQVLQPSQIEALIATKPRRGTLMGWPSVGQAVERIIEVGTR